MDDDCTPTTEEVEKHWANIGFAGDRASFRRWLDAERAAARAGQRESDAVITDGPHPANSGLDSFTLAHIGFTIRAAGTEPRQATK